MLEFEQSPKVLLEYIEQILSHPIFHEATGHFAPEYRLVYEDKIYKYYREEIKPYIYTSLFGSCNPKIIAATIIFKSLIPLNKNITIYGKTGSMVYSLITWRELGEILEKPNLQKVYHHYHKIKITGIDVDIEGYNMEHGFRRIVEECPHCGKYL